MGESPKFEHPPTPEEGEEVFTSEEKGELYLQRSEYLLEQLDTDPLTGAKSRVAFQAELSRALRFVRKEMDAHRAGIEPIGEVSVVFIDLDNFGQVNKSLGHHEGDEILKKVVKLIKDAVREMDTVGRFGGDEFLALLPRATEEIAVKRAHAILANLQADTRLQELRVGASIGVCSSTESTDDTEIVHFADKASREAKQGGKNQVRVYKGERGT